MTTSSSPTPPDPSNDPRRAERVFLTGPRRRRDEATTLRRVVTDFVNGFRTLHFVGPCVTVFGSARFAEGHEHYEQARLVGAEIGRRGFTVMTGGGPGVMEAANRGARDVGGPSIGCNIKLPHEQSSNPYVDTVVTFRYFFVRKVMLVKYSYGFVILPGGFGTLDEMFEALTLIQTKTIEGFPVALMGRAYWQSMLDQLDHMADASTIDPADLHLFLVTDDPVEAANHIERHAVKKFGLRRSLRPARVLRETPVR